MTNFLIGGGLSLLGGLFGGGARRKAEKRAFKYRKAEAEQQFGFQRYFQEQDIGNQRYMQSADIANQQYQQQRELDRQRESQIFNIDWQKDSQLRQLDLAKDTQIRDLGAQKERLGMQIGSNEKIATLQDTGETTRLGMSTASQERQQAAEHANLLRQKAEDAARARVNFGSFGALGGRRGNYGRGYF